jgi:phenylalanyl-tRNA synthetase beta chain
MKAPLSWLREFVEIDLPVARLAHLLTMAGMEVEEIRVIGLPLPESGSTTAHVSGFEWDREKIVVAEVSEVMQHPNADRLVLCKLNDGKQEHIVLTGAPNLFEFKGIGPLAQPLKVAYAKEGAQLYDGHQEGLVLTTLKRTKIRGVESYSMICSEKELGISDEHEGIMFLDPALEPGTALVDVLGDAVIDVNLLPSFARCASILGLAREIAAITGKSLNTPLFSPPPTIGEASFASLEISDPSLNPRFVLGLIRDVQIHPSPERVQQRLKLAGMRPINNVVDATNYAMLELGEPLHAFDYDVLQKRANGNAVKIITRAARQGETLTTLDGVERKLDEGTVLVCDENGILSIAGVMGGLESEVTESTRNILLEGAAWNMIRVRRTAKAQNLPSEASYRFTRGVHPSMAESGVRRGLQLMGEWAQGSPDPLLVDAYPQPFTPPVVEITTQDVKRWLGLDLEAVRVAELLARLEFKVEVSGNTVRATCPNHRMDISEGITGKADLIEEVARIHGYDNIPETRIKDALPLQLGNPTLKRTELIRDLLVALGLQEVISYRWTTPEKEGRRLPSSSVADDKPYVRIANPLAYEKSFMRHSVVASLLDTAERNTRHADKIALFEIGPVFMQSEDRNGLPDELSRLGMLLAGQRNPSGWQKADTAAMDYYDLKGIVEDLLESLHIEDMHYKPGDHPSYHPGKCALIYSGDQQLGVMGEIHPAVRERYDWGDTFRSPVLAADIDLDLLLSLIPELSRTKDIPAFPAVVEDLAIVLDESVPAVDAEKLIRQVGGKLLAELQLFDLFRGGQIGEGRKSLAYRLTYQSADRTLTDSEVAQVRNRIIKRLDQELGAKLRG